MAQLSLIWLCILWGFNLIIFTPYIIIITYRFYKDRTHAFIVKRRPLLVLSLIMIILITIDITRPLLSLNYIYKFIKIDENENEISQFWGDSTIFLLSTFLFCRAWKLFYDFKEEGHVLDLKWMKIVRSHQLYIPWTIKYKFLGNVKLLIFFSFLLYIIGFTMTLLINIYTNNTLYITITICSILGLLIIVGIYPFICILRIVHDFYQIHKELRYIFVIAFIILILFVIDILPNINIDSLIMYTLITITFIPLSLIQTQWVLYKKKRFLTHVNQRRTHGSIILAQRTETFNMNDNGNNSTPEIGVITKNDPNNNTFDLTHSTLALKLEDVLKTEKGFKMFANHLVRELTVEHLLFVLECMQLKNEMMRYGLMNREEIGWILDLPNSIIYPIEEQDEDNNMNNMDIRDELLSVFTYTDVIGDFDYLWKQYIDVNAQHSLNLSSKIRKRLLNQTKTYSLEFKKLGLDTLHDMTSSRSIKNVGISPRPKTTKSIKSSPKTLKTPHSDDINNMHHKMLSVENICPSIRIGHYSDILESEFSDFVDTEMTEEQIIDHYNHSHHSFHYNAKNRNVKKMKGMIQSLIDDIDRALNEVYRLIERDSYPRFTDTHDYIALEKLLYKKNRGSAAKQSQSINVNRL